MLSAITRRRIWTLVRPTVRLFSAVTMMWISLAIGIHLGLLIASSNIGNSFNEILGATVGAAIAVSGAAWVAESSRHRDREQTKRDILENLERLLRSSEKLHHECRVFVARDMPIGRGWTIYNEAISYNGVAKTVRRRIEFLRPAFMALGSVGAIAISDLEPAIEMLAKFVTLDDYNPDMAYQEERGRQIAEHIIARGETFTRGVEELRVGAMTLIKGA